MRFPLVVHVGLPKTGSSFFLYNLFYQIYNVDVLTNNLLTWPIVRDTIISNVFLSVFPYSTKFNKSPKIEDRSIILDRLFSLYGDVPIIVGIRPNSNDWINSLYSEYLRYDGTMSISRFRSNIDWDFCDHESYVNLIRSKFSNVFCYNYYVFKSDPLRTYLDMCNFLGILPSKFDNMQFNYRLDCSKFFRYKLYNSIQPILFKLLKGSNEVNKR